MNIAGRVLSWVLLGAVLLALGDAPYVDELFDAITPAAAHPSHVAQNPDTTNKQHSGIERPLRAIRLYQALASIFTAPSDIAVPPQTRAAGYRTATFRAPVSVDSSRLDRPPTARAA